MTKKELLLLRLFTYKTIRKNQAKQTEISMSQLFKNFYLETPGYQTKQRTSLVYALGHRKLLNSTTL